MTHQGVVLLSVFSRFCILLMITSKFVESTPSDRQDRDSKSKTAQDIESRTVPLSTSSIHRTNEVIKPSQIRNRRSNLLTEKEQFIDDNADLDSAFLYSDQIMQNLLKTQSPKPLSYAHSNFFLNLLKPRTTRYNAWDDHSLMHFGKRSVENNNGDKVLVKRSADLWPTENSLEEKKSSGATKSNQSPQTETDIAIPNAIAEEIGEETWIDGPSRSNENDGEAPQNVPNLDKKSNDPWHSMMSFGKKSQNPWDHSTMHFGKKNDPWHHKMSFGKRSDNMWDHSTMHFGKKNDPWHSMMSFGKRSETSDETDLDKRDDPWHNMMSFGKKSDPWHSMMSFGKRSENPWDHSTLHFGKRDDPWHNMMSFGKKSDPWHSMMSFGKRTDFPWDHNTLHFGKKDDPWHNMMSFGKRSDYPWDHNTLHFGKKSEQSDETELEKREDPWHNMMSFGKKSDPWHSMMSFGKRYENPWDHSTLHFGKRDDPWHNMMSFGKKSDPWHSMMSFGKRSDYPWDHNTLHFGKKNDPWHSMMSFGKRSDIPDEELEKRDDPWHNMMSFGKRLENPWNINSTTADKREEPWHNMMSFGKKSDIPWDHNTLHFGKKDDPWHNMMSFGKKSDFPWDHNTLHFGKKDDPWHNMMSFGKKSDFPWDHNTLHFGKKDDPWHNMMSFGKKSDFPWDHSTLHFGKRDDPWHNMMSFGKRSNGMIEDDEIEDISDPWGNYNGMVFYKKYDPWDHNTLHFGKKANTSLNSILSPEKSETTTSKHIQKRSAGTWGDHQTMHFGKKSYPWENHDAMFFEKESGTQNLADTGIAEKKFDWAPHNTMHFGKKSDPWDYHNTMHFGKKRNPWDSHNSIPFGQKRDPWDYHSTMHFGKKRNPWDYHSTMHFGKKSDDENSLKETDTSSTGNEKNEINERNTEEIEFETAQNQDNKGLFETTAPETKNEVSIRKRSTVSVTSKLKDDSIYKNYKSNVVGSENSETESYMKSSDNQKKMQKNQIIERSVKSTEEPFDERTNGVTRKSGYDFPEAHSEKQIVKPNVINSQANEKDSKKNKTHMNKNNDSKSRITKRSIENDKLNRDSSENLDPNARVFEEYAKDDFPDTVLHFGKRSVDISRDGPKQFENQWLDDAEKRFDSWDNQNILHFGKKSYPWDSHTVMHFGKRNPWDYHSTMHFGKKFDPWEGHHQMHFGKRSGDWEHSVMHFGKRDEIKDNQLQSAYNAEDILTLLSDPEKLKELLQEINPQEGPNEMQNKELLEDLENLEKVINFHLRDDSISFDEKLNLLRSYLKPILKTILSREIIEEIDVKNPLLDESKEYVDGDITNNMLNDDGNSDGIPTRSIINDNSYEGDTLPADDEGNSNANYEENSKLIDYLKNYKDYLKSKRMVLGKPELKRYFVPFQGPKSIVYPHAWFASQIRRSALPRTTDFARSMEMRMAEKKEDPFNSYMHFGRR